MKMQHQVERSHASNWKEAGKLLAEIAVKHDAELISDVTPKGKAVHFETTNSGYRWRLIDDEGEACFFGYIMVEEPSD